MRFAFYLKLFAVLGLLLLKFCAANSKPSDSDRIHFLWNEPLSYYFYSEQNLAQQIMGAYDSLFLNRADKTILLALKDADEETLKKSYFLLGLYYQLNHNYQESFSSFQQALNYTHEVSEIAILHVKSAVSKQNEDHFLEALEYLRQAKIIIYKKELYDLEAEIQLEEGFCYTRLLNYAAAESRLKAAQLTVSKAENPILVAKLFNYLGAMHLKQKNYLVAQSYFLQAIKSFGSDTLQSLYVNTLKQTGTIYWLQNNKVQALAQWNDALTMALRIHNKKEAADLSRKIALVFIENQPDKALRFLKQAEKYGVEINNKMDLGLTNIGLANYYVVKNKRDSAKYYLTKAANNKLIQNNPTTTYQLNKALSQYYSLIQKKDSSRYYMDKIVAFANNQDDLEIKSEAYFFYAEAMHQKRNFEQAFLLQGKAQHFKDSLLASINTYDLKRLQSELESNRQQSLINNLTKERNQQNHTILQNRKTLEKQKGWLYFSGIILLFILVVSLLLGLFLYQRKKDNRKLALRNRQIAQQKEEIEVQRQHLVEINQELEKLSIIARETDNGIRIMNEVGRVLWVNEGYIKLHGFTLEELTQAAHYDLLGEESDININQLVRVWYGDKKPISYEALVKNKWQQKIWVQTTLTPILDAQGKVSKMIAIDSDITRIKNAEQEILTKNADITASISYAKRIQEAMMTPFHILTDVFPESFCFYKPKSIVSGDFYWLSHKHDRLIVACADSTGHGVPGAFMSLIGISFLNKIVNEKGFVSPAIILNRLRMNVISHLHQTNGENLAGDGMDISIISIDLKNKLLEFAGAMNPIIIMRNQDLIELKPDRMPVGFFDNEDRPFSSTSISLKPNDQIYLFTDGYYDQFGGLHCSKMKSQRFRDILKDCAHKPISEQKQLIEDRFNKWRGNNHQVDDILLMGIHID